MALITGTNAANRLEGRRANDTIEGLGGNDTIEGYGGNGLINAGAGNDRAEGGAGDDTVNGGAGNDLVEGYQGADRLDGGTGNDRLDGGVGNDLLTGGAGRDRFIFEDNAGRDTVTDFTDGQDLIVVDGAPDRFSDLVIGSNGAGDAVVSWTQPGGNLVEVTLLGVDAASLSAADFVFIA